MFSGRMKYEVHKAVKLVSRLSFWFTGNTSDRGTGLMIHEQIMRQMKNVGHFYMMR